MMCFLMQKDGSIPFSDGHYNKSRGDLKLLEKIPFGAEATVVLVGMFCHWQVLALNNSLCRGGMVNLVVFCFSAMMIMSPDVSF